jgi:hypothetical protein
MGKTSVLDGIYLKYMTAFGNDAVTLKLEDLLS